MTHQNPHSHSSAGVSKVITNALLPIGFVVAAQAALASSSGVFNIRDCGAMGDGKTAAAGDLVEVAVTDHAGRFSARMKPGRGSRGVEHFSVMDGTLRVRLRRMRLAIATIPVAIVPVGALTSASAVMVLGLARQRFGLRRQSLRRH